MRAGWIGDHAAWGTLACSYVATPTSSECGKPSTYHLITEEVSADGTHPTITACDQHFAIASTLAVDSHPVGGVCNIPGTVWVIGTADKPGRCLWPPAEEAQAVEALADSLQPAQ